MGVMHSLYEGGGADFYRYRFLSISVLFDINPFNVLRLTIFQSECRHIENMPHFYVSECIGNFKFFAILMKWILKDLI